MRSGYYWTDYYAVVADDRTIDNPYGLVRRLEHDDGPSDEGLRKDFTWAHTPAIVEWERGDLGPELVEVSHEQASKIIEYFRQKWGRSGSRSTREPRAATPSPSMFVAT
jgi:hypothetical protein